MEGKIKGNAALGAVLALLFIVGTGAAAAQSQQSGNLAALQTSFREVSKNVLPTVVELKVSGTVTQRLPEYFSPFGYQGGSERTIPVAGLGSGIIVRRTGNTYYVLTNYHVVENAKDVTVRLSDQKEFKAAIVGKDSNKDLAMVSFTSTDALPVAALGDSDAVSVGDIVLAVGNPFGYESTITMGIVSAVGRRGPQESSVSPYTTYIQTDAAINEGNSGGALVNIEGQVVGINTWIAGTTGGNVGLGFAIPINTAKKNVEDFIAKGKVQYGWLGVQPIDVQGSDTYEGYAKDLKVEGVNGSLVLNVYKNSPAATAGLLPGDYVTRIENQDVKDSSDFTGIVGGLQAGKTYRFTVIRGGKSMDLQVKPGVRDDDSLAAQSKNLWPGMTVLDLTGAVRNQINVSLSQRGVVVAYMTDSGTPAAIGGMRVGDVITDVNGTAIGNVADYFKAVNAAGRNLSFTLIRQGTTIKVGLTK